MQQGSSVHNLVSAYIGFNGLSVRFIYFDYQLFQCHVFVSSGNAAIKRVVRTVLVLTVVYVFSWTPYWISLVSYRFFPAGGMNRTRKPNAK
jgi:hypothetical protein